MSGHDHDVTMANDGYGGEMYDEGGNNEARMTKLQIFMGRTLAGWPLYAIIISLGQLISAVSNLEAIGDQGGQPLMPDLVPAVAAGWIQYPDRARPVHHLFDLRRCYAGLVHALPNEALGLRSLAALAHVSSHGALAIT